MALNPIPVGDAIADFIQTQKPAPGAVITVAELKTMWEGIVTILYNDLKANLGVSAGSFEVEVTTGDSAGTYPVTGVGGPAS
jgi:hypothetical protein